MRLLLDPGLLPYEAVRRAVLEFVVRNELLVVLEGDHQRGWASGTAALTQVRYRDLEDVGAGKLCEAATFEYDGALAFVLNDLRTPLLAARVYGSGTWNSQFTHIRRVEKQVANALQLLLTRRPSHLLFQATPHHIRQWTLAKTAEYLGIPVLMFQTSPLPWRFWVVRGLDTQAVVSLRSMGQGVETPSPERARLEEYVSTIRGGYLKAIPSYEKARFDRRRGKTWSWRREAADVLRHPRHWVRLAHQLSLKRQLYRAYEGRATEDDSGRKTVVYFMHFQPERTSLPEGKQYAQQWLAIRTLSFALPEEYDLIVKEHPSTFVGRFRPEYRSPDLYRDIARLPRVRTVSIGTDTFELVDRATAVATMTGLVGVQALVRGVPVLAFGHASYRGAPNVFSVSKVQDAASAIRQIEGLTREMIRQQTEAYLRGTMMASLSAFDEEDTETGDLFNPRTRINGHARLLNAFLGIEREIASREESGA